MVSEGESATTGEPGACLLAVDVGLRCGLALFGSDGRLRRYCSRHMPNRGVLRRASRSILADIPGLTHVVLEGGGPVAAIWEHQAERVGARVLRVSADDWRRVLLHPRDRRRGREAKSAACRFARDVIEWSGASRPTSFGHDAAEAILVGLWGVLSLGWLEAVPPVLNS